MNEGGLPTTLSFTPTVPVSCPPCTMTLNIASYIGLKVSRCSMMFSKDDPIHASKSMTIEAVETLSSYSRIVKMVFSSFIPQYPGSGWDNYTPDYCVVCISL